jgi:2-keto-4-pentenoate hydratase/2-oxohepta-3-ene-1,7-dioic acid hydratase in catechol pathway
MKLVSFFAGDAASWGLLDGTRIVDLGRRYRELYPSLRSAIGSALLADPALASLPADYDLAEVRLLPPIPDPGKILCVGLNYKAHAAEGGFAIPEFPQVFTRFADTLVGSGQPMVKPAMSDDFDFEGELAIVIGRGGRHIPVGSALEHVFGYTCFNDGSVRDVQFKHFLIAGKNFPNTGPLGPCIVTTDEIPDPSQLQLITRINGREVQNKRTDDMICDVAGIIAYISGWTELRPGDVIATGTPEGVGFARKPPLWIKPGDLVEVEISKIGVLSNRVEAGP